MGSGEEGINGLMDYWIGGLAPMSGPCRLAVSDMADRQSALRGDGWMKKMSMLQEPAIGCKGLQEPQGGADG